MNKKIIILDRDGVINEQNHDYICNTEQFDLIESSLDAISALKSNGWGIGVATNQPGIERKYFSEQDLDVIHNKMLTEIRKNGGNIDIIEHCPHIPDTQCECRKPKGKMIEKILKHFNLPYKEDVLKDIYFVGDSVCDVELAINNGLKPCLVKTGDGLETMELLPKELLEKTKVVDNLMALVEELI